MRPYGLDRPRRSRRSSVGHPTLAWREWPVDSLSEMADRGSWAGCNRLLILRNAQYALDSSDTN